MQDEVYTVTMINSFSGTAVAGRIENGCSVAYKIAYTPDRPQLAEGDKVRVSPIGTDWARVTEVIRE